MNGTYGGWFSGLGAGRDVELDTDVVVVGSGAGGATVARELAESGWRVVVLEEGPRVTPEEIARMRASEHLRHMWRDGALTVAVGLGDTPAINVTMGRCVGGSSALTGGVCFRLPEQVLADWRDRFGLRDYTPEALDPVAEHVERRLHVEEVPRSRWSRSTELFQEGARALGYDLEPLRRNTQGCRGCGRCNFGCPHKAKRSVDLSYLPQAVRAGAQVWSHCLVERVVVRRGRAVGVCGRLLDGPGGRKGHRLRVRARRVVLAAGAWHDPLLLQRSGLHRGLPVGRNLTLHPAFRMMARFEEPVRGWAGALQAAYSRAFEEEGITLVGLFIPPGVQAATIPGVGPALAERAAQLDHYAIFGGMIHDTGSGTVRPGPGREPVVTYRMSRRDRALVPRVVRLLAETFFAAGAKECYLPVMGLEPVTADTLRQAPLEQLPAGRFECASQHPLGSCRMGSAPDHAVVDADGRHWHVDDLYVADGAVLPSSLGVNPQLSIMTVATRIAWRLRERPLSA